MTNRPVKPNPPGQRRGCRRVHCATLGKDEGGTCSATRPKGERNPTFPGADARYNVGKAFAHCVPGRIHVGIPSLDERPAAKEAFRKLLARNNGTVARLARQCNERGPACQSAGGGGGRGGGGWRNAGARSTIPSTSTCSQSAQRKWPRHLGCVPEIHTSARVPTYVEGFARWLHLVPVHGQYLGLHRPSGRQDLKGPPSGTCSAVRLNCGAMRPVMPDIAWVERTTK